MGLQTHDVPYDMGLTLTNWPDQNFGQVFPVGLEES
jgi:hypothetical protein